MSYRTAPYRTASVASADGTILGTREFGRGPGVVLLHGAMQSARSFTRIAEALATDFTVHVPDRRGRGRSGPFGDDYGLARETEDLAALLRKTGARRVFGLSSGALIALHAVTSLDGIDAIDKLALYEPPLVTDDADPTAWVPRYERALDRGALASAMVSVIKGTGDVGWLTRAPRFVLVPLFALALRADARAARGDDVPIAALVPTVRFDARLARESEVALARVAAIRCDVLLMGGDRSAVPLRRALAAVAARMPRAKRVELEGAGHLAADDGGQPEKVAAALRDFFGARPTTAPTSTPADGGSLVPGARCGRPAPGCARRGP